MIKIYLDACIFVADFYKKDKVKHKTITKTLEKISKNKNIKLVTSDFTFTETAKVLIREKKVERNLAFEYVSRVNRSKKIQGIPFEILKPEGKVPKGKVFEFSDFFLAMQEEILNYSKCSFADATHTVIMRTNHIKRILTFDGDFDNILGIIVIKPKDIFKKLD